MDQVDQIQKSFLTQNPCLLLSEAEDMILKFREGFKVLDRHIRYPSKEHILASETFISLLTSIKGNRRELFSALFWSMKKTPHCVPSQGEVYFVLYIELSQLI